MHACIIGKGNIPEFSRTSGSWKLQPITCHSHTLGNALMYQLALAAYEDMQWCATLKTSSRNLLCTLPMYFMQQYLDRCFTVTSQSDCPQRNKCIKPSLPDISDPRTYQQAVNGPAQAQSPYGAAKKLVNRCIRLSMGVSGYQWMCGSKASRQACVPCRSPTSS